MLKKIKKAVFSGIFFLSICIIFSACSGGDSANKLGPSVSAGTPETSSRIQDHTDTKLNEPPKGSDSPLQINVGDGEHVSAQLPDTYPVDVFPLNKDSFIVSALEFGRRFYRYSLLARTIMRRLQPFTKSF
jgi:hypothetical protein